MVVLAQMVFGFVVAVCIYAVLIPSCYGILTSIGLISYEVYLVHGPVRNCLLRHLTNVDAYWSGLAVIVVSLVTGWVFARFMFVVGLGWGCRKKFC